MNCESIQSLLHWLFVRKVFNTRNNSLKCIKMTAIQPLLLACWMQDNSSLLQKISYSSAEYSILMRRHTFLLFFKHMALVALHITFLSFSLSPKLGSAFFCFDERYHSCHVFFLCRSAEMRNCHP
jgi:hypothetical protein